MHVGHCRGAVVGDALANLMGFAGYEVTKEYYINDAGSQIDVLAKSVFCDTARHLARRSARSRQGFILAITLSRSGRASPMNSAPAQGDAGSRAHAHDQGQDHRCDDGDDPLIKALNVEHDVFFSERSLHADSERAIRNAINDLTFKGHVYKGKLPPPKGQSPEDWEDREQTLFRSTEVGDDIDRPLIKSDGSPIPISQLTLPISATSSSAVSPR
jgi:arginyl-tRNA synthetase